ncbi:MAG: TlpA family protein disulfide reductase [Lachnospiraceae bacterium]|nr:TlpA family protein disulfide reductase [Lachnospiraceae bacterium]
MKMRMITALLLTAAMTVLAGCSTTVNVNNRDDGKNTAVTDEKEPEDAAEEKTADEEITDKTSADEPADVDLDDYVEVIDDEPDEFFDSDDPYERMIGKKIEFTATDMDGNTITSEEIFSQHEYTMVNAWATWCGWCVKELPDLAKLDKELAEKDCAIIGILGDGTDGATIEDGRQLLKQTGCTYLNLLPWDGALEDDFPITYGWPTSFFVDREGRMAAYPVVGADLDGYKATFNELLAK